VDRVDVVGVLQGLEQWAYQEIRWIWYKLLYGRR